MNNPIKQFEKNTNQKLKEFDGRIKTSFILIRQDLDEMQNTINAMRKYLKKKDKEHTATKKSDDKTREEFVKDVDEFTQNIKQLKKGLDAVRKLKREVVVRKDLAKIEERIKTLFRNDLEDYKYENKQLKVNQKELEKRIIALENGYVKTKKPSRFQILETLKSANKSKQEILNEDNIEEKMELSKIKDNMLNEKEI
ncbi:hypothetical protein KAS08_02735 [Candidatus Pacearchaeota archaeon]|nr:hypothetical protein [Candidatus Pacearchaeota archaeon]